MVSSPAEPTGIMCASINIPKSCEWAGALLTGDRCENYLLLDNEGLMGIRYAHPTWVEVSFEELSKYYSVYLLGIDPIATYNEVHNVLP